MTHCAHDRRQPIRDRWDGLEARSQIAARPRSRPTGPRPPTARLARGHASTARGRSPVLPRHDFAHWLERGPGRPPGPRSTTAPEHRTPTSTRHGPSNTAAGCHHPAGSAPSGIAEFYCSSPEPSGRRAQPRHHRTRSCCSGTNDGRSAPPPFVSCLYLSCPGSPAPPSVGLAIAATSMTRQSRSRQWQVLRHRVFRCCCGALAVGSRPSRSNASRPHRRRCSGVDSHER